MTDEAKHQGERRRVRGGDVASVGGSLAAVAALLIGGRDVSQRLDALQTSVTQKLDAIGASVTEIKAEIAVMKAVKAEDRLRALEIGGVERNAKLDAHERRLDALEARQK